MPTNLELLKSIHENGGEFEVRSKSSSPFSADIIYEYSISDDWESSPVFKLFHLKDDKTLYYLPSELEVEKKIVEFCLESGMKYNALYYEHIDVGWIWLLTYGSKEYGKQHKATHESRLTACLMLWDKLLKEKR